MLRRNARSPDRNAKCSAESQNHQIETPSAPPNRKMRRRNAKSHQNPRNRAKGERPTAADALQASDDGRGVHPSDCYALLARAMPLVRARPMARARPNIFLRKMENRRFSWPERGGSGEAAAGRARPLARARRVRRGRGRSGEAAGQSEAAQKKRPQAGFFLTDRSGPRATFSLQKYPHKSVVFGAVAPGGWGGEVYDFLRFGVALSICRKQFAFLQNC